MGKSTIMGNIMTYPSFELSAAIYGRFITYYVGSTPNSGTRGKDYTFFVLANMNRQQIFIGSFLCKTKP